MCLGIKFLKWTWCFSMIITDKFFEDHLWNLQTAEEKDLAFACITIPTFSFYRNNTCCSTSCLNMRYVFHFVFATLDTNSSRLNLFCRHRWMGRDMCRLYVFISLNSNKKRKSPHKEGFWRTVKCWCFKLNNYFMSFLKKKKAVMKTKGNGFLCYF